MHLSFSAAPPAPQHACRPKHPCTIIGIRDRLTWWYPWTCCLTPGKGSTSTCWNAPLHLSRLLRRHSIGPANCRHEWSMGRVYHRRNYIEADLTPRALPLYVNVSAIFERPRLACKQIQVNPELRFFLIEIPITFTFVVFTSKRIILYVLFLHFIFDNFF